MSVCVCVCVFASVRVCVFQVRFSSGLSAHICAPKSSPALQISFRRPAALGPAHHSSHVVVHLCRSSPEAPSPFRIVSWPATRCAIGSQVLFSLMRGLNVMTTMLTYAQTRIALRIPRSLQVKVPIGLSARICAPMTSASMQTYSNVEVLFSRMRDEA